MTAEIISVGTELLLGQITNTDTQILSRRLSSIGISVFHTQVVGDNLARLEETLRQAMNRSDIVIMTGGLGPTDDDITKRAVARVADVPLTMCDEAEKRIRDYMARTNREVNEANLRQAMMPKGCKVLLNDFGTAPGCVVNCENKLIILLPGPPRELEPMFVNQVEPILAAQSKNVISSEYIRVFGISEAAIQEKLSDIFAGSSPTVSPYAKAGEVELRITASAENEERAKAICRPVADEIKARLGNKVYTDKYESLQETVVKLFKENGQTVATAESCTGGLLSKRITEIAGSSNVFSLGMCTYSAEEKINRLGVNAETVQKYGVVSHQVACEMAEGIRKLSGATVGIGITGVAGPDTDEKGTPVGTVYIALSDAISVYCREVHIGRGKNERELVRTVAASHALDMLRLFAEGNYEAIGTALNVPKMGITKASETKDEPKKKLSLWQRFLRFFTDFPSDSIGEKLRKSVMVLSIIALTVALVFIGDYCYNMIVSDQSIGKAIKLEQQAEQMTPEQEAEAREELEEVLGIDDAYNVQKWTLDLLKENKDMVGKLSIDGVMDTHYVTQSKDNDYYVKYDFFGNRNSLGNPFLDYRCDGKNLSANNIIYGHSTKSANKMFNKLQTYKNVDSVRKHYLIDYNTLYNDYQWKIFAVMITNTTNQNGEVFDYLKTDFTSVTEYENFIADCRARSIWDIDVDVTANDRILTLSTCTFEIDGARIVIMARQVRDGENTSTAPTVTKNEDCIYFKAWAEKFGGNYVDSTWSRPNSNVSSTVSNNGTSSEIEQGRVEITEETFAAIPISVYCEKNGSVRFDMPYINSFGTEMNLARGERPENGSCTAYASSLEVSYTPDRDFVGVDTFTVILNEESLEHSSEATVTVYVGTEKQSGVTLEENSTEISCDAGETVEIKLPGQVHGNSKIYYAVSQYEGLKAGTAEIVDGTLEYTQTTEKKRRDTIKILICDKNLVGDIYTITVNKESREPTSEETVATPSQPTSDASSRPTSSQTSSSVSSRPTSSQTSSSVSSRPTSSQTSSNVSSSPASSSVASETPTPSETPVSSETPIPSEEPVSSKEEVTPSEEPESSETQPEASENGEVSQETGTQENQSVTAEPTA